MQKEGINHKTESELQKEIEKRSNQTAKEVLDLMNILKKVSNTDKAAMFILLNQLAGKANIIQESDITITVNQKNISMREYLEKYLANADYDKAKSMSDGFLNDIRQVQD